MMRIQCVGKGMILNHFGFVLAKSTAASTQTARPNEAGAQNEKHETHLSDRHCITAYINQHSQPKHDIE